MPWSKNVTSAMNLLIEHPKFALFGCYPPKIGSGLKKSDICFTFWSVKSSKNIHESHICSIIEISQGWLNKDYQNSITKALSKISLLKRLPSSSLALLFKICRSRRKIIFILLSLKLLMGVSWIQAELSVNKEVNAMSLLYKCFLIHSNSKSIKTKKEPSSLFAYLIHFELQR